eukprot:UN14840
MAWSSSTGRSCRSGICADSRLYAAQYAMDKVIADNEDSIDFGLMRFNGLDGGYILNGIGKSSSIIRNSIGLLPASGDTPLTENFMGSLPLYYGKKFRLGIEC